MYQPKVQLRRSGETQEHAGKVTKVPYYMESFASIEPTTAHARGPTQRDEIRSLMIAITAPAQ